jgi:hypothetical protein
VDPRPHKLNKWQLQQLKGAGHTVVMHTLTQPQLEQGPVATEGWAHHHHQQLQQGTQPPTAASAAALFLANAEAAAGGPEPCMPAQPSEAHFWQVQGWFGPQLWQSSGWQQLFGVIGGSGISSRSGSKGCSLVVGLHPDQATEPILDYAVQEGCPFAVVPCCVFPRLFPDRRLVGEGGEALPVNTYPQLVEYLKIKGRGQQQVLGFEGANTVVYSSLP